MADTTIYDVAKYILHKLGKMSAIKLQKLCYYSQVWSLVWDNALLFDEDFQAWASGPICKELFDLCNDSFEVSEDSPCVKSGNIQKLNSNQQETIETVLKHYGDKSSQWLSNLTYMEKPWSAARQGVPLGVHCFNIITKDSMKLYYQNLL